MRLGLSTKITQIRAASAVPLIEYETTETTYDPSPAVDGTTHNPDAYVGKTATVTFSTETSYLLGRYGTKASNRVDHVIFTRYEVDVPAGATITGVKLQYWGLGVEGTDDLDISGGFVLPGPSGGGWEDSTGVLEWTSWLNDVPLAQRLEGQYLEDRVEYPEVFAANTTASAGPAFKSVPTPLTTVTFQNYSFGDELTATTDVTGLVDQLQNYIDNQESLRGHIVAGKIPVLVQLYVDWPSPGNHYQGLVQEDGTWNDSYRPSLTVRYTSAI